MKCNKCGTDNPSDNFFCINCGTHMEVQVEAQEPWDSGTPLRNDAQTQDYSQQNNFDQQPYEPSGAQQAAAEKAAKKSLICGILSFVLGSTICLVLAIIFFCEAKKGGYIGKKHTVGLILAIVGLVLWSIAGVFLGIIFARHLFRFLFSFLF